MSDFSDRPFVAGSITGLRSFRVDQLGRLTGVTVKEVFRPDENVARCLSGGTPRYASGGYITAASASTSLQADVTRAMHRLNNCPGCRKCMTAPAPVSTSAPVMLHHTERAEHRVAQQDCQCGFYAYFDGGANPYHEDGKNVLAIVEGYGTVTVGSRGYRAEKAKLVALVDPAPKPSSPHRFMHPRWYDWLADHSGPFAAGISPLAASAAITAACVAATNGLWAVSAIAMPIFALAVIWGFASFHSIPREHPRVSNTSRCHDSKPRGATGPAFDLVRRNYPDVPVYPTLKAALAAHPVTPPPVPVIAPDTVDDFWTRSAR